MSICLIHSRMFNRNQFRVSIEYWITLIDIHPILMDISNYRFLNPQKLQELEERHDYLRRLECMVDERDKLIK